MINPEPQSKNSNSTKANNKANEAGKTSRRSTESVRPQSSVPKTYNMRCPSCAKLYKVQVHLIASQSPHFDCQVCHCQFTFQYPPQHPNSIQTRLLRKSPTGQMISPADFNENHFRKCSKCNQISPKSSQECVHCRAIFARLDGLPLDAKMGALPSLVKMWNELMADYENMTKHVAFVDRCEELQALPFALKKYQILKEAQPQDEIVNKIFSSLLVKNIGATADRMAEASKLRYISSKIHWPRVIKIAPIALSLIFILLGFSIQPLRNLVGVGVALSVLTIGLRFIQSGRIRWDDYF